MEKTDFCMYVHNIYLNYFAQFTKTTEKRELLRFSTVLKQ